MLRDTNSYTNIYIENIFSGKHNIVPIQKNKEEGIYSEKLTRTNLCRKIATAIASIG